MNRQCWTVCLLFICVVCNSGCLGTGFTVLLPQSLDVWENTDATLSCSYTGNESAFNIIWYMKNQILRFGNCIPIDWLNNTTLYSYHCPNNTFHVVTLKSISQQRNMEVWKCSFVDMNGKFFNSTETKIFVKVPVKSVVISPYTSTLTQTENSTLMFQCESSPCRPKPKFRWYVVTPENTENILTETNSDGNSDEITSYRNSFTLTLNRTWTGLRFYCGAQKEDNFVISQLISLNVTYPPKERPHIGTFENGREINVIKDRFVYLECSVSGGNPLPRLEWNKNNDIPQIVSGSVVTRGINWTAIDITRDKLICQLIHPDMTDTAYVTVNVLYSAKVTALYIEYIDETVIKGHSNISVIEGTHVKLVCNATGNPPPTYSWSCRPTTKDNKLDMGILMKEDHVNCTCFVENTIKPSFGSSMKTNDNSTVFINVLYSPSIQRLDNVTVLEGSKFTRICNIVPGNTELLGIRWMSQGSSLTESNTLNISNISRNNDSTYTCIVQYTMNPTGLVKLNMSKMENMRINVAFPPEKVAFSLRKMSSEYVHIVNTISIIEDDQLFLNCSAESNPPVSDFEWKGVMSSTNPSLHTNNIRRSQTGDVICNVYNTMKLTEPDQTVLGHSNSTLHIDVLYPPIVNALEEKTIAEGEDLVYLCNFTPGNPNSTTFLWRRENDTLGTTQQQQQLALSHVSRNQSGTYACSVFNNMTATDGRMVLGNDSGHFKLIVEYKANVQRFVLEYEGLEITDNFTVNENETVKLVCKIEGRPLATGELNFREADYLERNTMGLQLQNSSISDSETLQVVRVFKAQCTDSGIHSCTGTNKLYTGLITVANQNLSLNVNCKPRKSPFHRFPSGDSVGSATFATVTLNFTTLAYPIPPVSGYVWSRQVNEKMSNWTTITSSDTSLVISTSGLQSNLTIKNVTRFDFGHYRVMVENEIGSFEYIFNLTAAESPPNKLTKSTNVAAAVGGVMSGLLALVIVVIAAVIIVRKRSLGKQEHTGGENCDFKDSHTYTNFSREMNINTSNADDKALFLETKQTSLDSPKLPERMPLKLAAKHNLQELDDYDDKNERIYDNTYEKIKRIDRIHVSELLPYLMNKPTDFFGLEFQNLPKGLTKPYEFSQKPENIALNRYNGIYPYDHSRVKLADDPTYFINACYINGYRKKKEFIASLGPLSRTTYNFVTFWQMVWSESSDVIVMLTKLKEPSGVKCDQYWPENDTAIAYGEITVTSLGEEEYSDYVLRKFTVSKGNKKRKLVQFHFIAWPDKSVPEDVTCVLEFRKRVHANHSSGPIIVHCSAGIGRTGTLIALEILIEEGRREGSVNVVQCVKTMRDQRTSMVQTVDQYHYIYKALANALVFDCESISLQKFPKYLDKINTDQFNKMFQTFNQSVESDSTVESNARTANKMQRDKNRMGCDIPGDSHRVRLFLNRYEETSTDYINAVYIDSLKKNEHFIVAQSPMTDGVEEFLCMIYQVECSCIVSLGDSHHGRNVGMFIPTDDTQSLAIGCFKVTCKVLDTKENYIIRKVRIEFKGKYEGGEKDVYHFEYNDWALGQKTPSDHHKFVAFTLEVEEFASQLGTGKSQVLVHCLNAFERSCLFCAVVTLVEKVKYEGEVCVPNTLRHIRARRKLAIPNMEQFQFCFKAVLAYTTADKTGPSVEEKAYINMTLV